MESRTQNHAPSSVNGIDAFFFHLFGIQMEHFYSEKVKTTKNAKKLVRTFESALDVARANMKWVTTNGRVIERWLDRKLLELM